MRVFDISYWQDDNAVQKIINLGAEGVILRLGYTSNRHGVLDEKFEYFKAEAERLGLPFGIYYYSKMNDQEVADKEAQFINDRVYDLCGGEEPPMGVWWDMEDQTTMWYGVYPVLWNVIERMQGWGFKKVGIYSSYSYYHEWLSLDDIAAKQIPVWVAQYSNTNNLLEERPELNHYGWQFTEAYDGNSLDGNEWYKI